MVGKKSILIGGIIFCIITIAVMTVLNMSIYSVLTVLIAEIYAISSILQGLRMKYADPVFVRVGTIFVSGILIVATFAVTILTSMNIGYVVGVYVIALLGYIGVFYFANRLYHNKREIDS